MAEIEQEKPVVARSLVVLAAIVIILAGLKTAGSLLVPFLFAGFLAMVCARPLAWLQSHNVPTVVALLLLIFGISACIVLVGALVAMSVTDFFRELPQYQASLQQQTDAFVQWLDNKGVEITSATQKQLSPQRAMQFIAGILSDLSNVLGNIFLLVILVAFMLIETAGLRGKVEKISVMMGRSAEPLFRSVVEIRRYVAIKTWICLLTGVMITVLLLIVGVNYALLWGLLGFLLNYVPNIGSVIAAVPAVFLALIQPDLGVGPAVVTIVGYLVINTVIGNIIEPRVTGRGLGLSPLAVLISLFVWGWVFGPVGMILSVPLTMTLKIICESMEQTRWLAVLLGPEVEASETVEPSSTEPTVAAGE